MNEIEARRLADIEQLKAMAHPLRMKLFYALATEGVTTASHLAEIIKASPALVSYHLRQLSAQGFVTEVANLDGDHRKRWWKSTGRGFTFSVSDFEDQPKERAAARELAEATLGNQIGKVNEFYDRTEKWSPEWAKAAFSSDGLLKLSPTQLAQMHQEIESVVTRWKSAIPEEPAHAPQKHDGPRNGHDSPTTQPVENVFFFMHAVPFRQ